MTIKFLSFNIQSCRDYVKRNFDPLLMANTIRYLGSEIIGLNEVRSDGSHPDFFNHTKIIAESLGYDYYYFGQALTLDSGPYGNAIISKYPIKRIKTFIIPDPVVKDEDAYYETRGIIKAEIADFTVLITHVGLAKSEQTNAIKTIMNLIDDIKTPIVLMGDFNMEPNNPLLSPIYSHFIDTATFFSTPLLSFPSINPVKKIDYIFVTPEIEIITADIPQITASDHYPHTATLKIPSQN